jgi:peptidoglycan/LPS O-acetylase OafA/YrhL
MIHPVIIPEGIVHQIVFNLVGDPAISFKLTAIFMSGACFRLYRDKMNFHPVVLATFAAVWLVSFLTSHFIEIVTGILGAYILLWAATGLKSELLQRINNKYDYSYGAYLYAWPIASFILLFSLNRFAISPIGLSVVTAILSLIAGAISWHFLEKPALRYKRTRDVLPTATDELVVAKPADLALPG